MLHLWLLDALLGVMLDVPAKDSRRHGASIHRPDVLKLVLSILHLFLLLLKNLLELTTLDLISLSLRNLSFGNSSTRLERQSLAVVLDLAFVLAFLLMKLASLVQVLLGKMSH